MKTNDDADDADDTYAGLKQELEAARKKVFDEGYAAGFRAAVETFRRHQTAMSPATASLSHDNNNDNMANKEEEDDDDDDDDPGDIAPQSLSLATRRQTTRGAVAELIKDYVFSVAEPVSIAHFKTLYPHVKAPTRYINAKKLHDAGIIIINGKYWKQGNHAQQQPNTDDDDDAAERSVP